MRCSTIARTLSECSIRCLVWAKLHKTATTIRRLIISNRRKTDCMLDKR